MGNTAPVSKEPAVSLGSGYPSEGLWSRGEYLGVQKEMGMGQGHQGMWV